MDEITKNLKKLQDEVTQINNISQTKSDDNKNIKVLNIPFIRIIILFICFFGLIYTINPDFCCEEVINEQTFFKEKKLNLQYAVIISILLSVMIFYLTYQINI